MTSLLKVLKNDDFILSGQVVEIPDVELDNLKKNIDVSNDSENLQGDESIETDIDDAAASKFMEQAMIQIETERQEILNQAKLECEQIKRQAFEDAYNEAIQCKKSEIENSILSASNALVQLENKIEDYMSQYEENLRILAIDIASKILAKRIENNDADMLELVKHALESVNNSEWVSITISEKAMKLYNALAEDLKASIDSKDIQIHIKDLPNGYCTIETPNGLLDISISEQIENLKACFQQ